jgi:hypothetical protein
MDYVYLLLVQGLGYLKQALVIVTLFAKQRPDECAESIDVEASFKIVVRWRAWRCLLPALNFIELGRVGGGPPCLLKILYCFNLLRQLWAAR